MHDVLFPNAPRGNIIPRSAATDDYNCLSWALRVDTFLLWPDAECQFGWPIDVPRGEDLASVLKFFAVVGFDVTQSDRHVVGWEKVAIYGIDDLVCHFARQLPDGIWTSKLGMGADVEHRLLSDLGDQYGSVCAVVQRRWSQEPPPLPPLHPPGITVPRLVGPDGFRL